MYAGIGGCSASNNLKCGGHLGENKGKDMKIVSCVEGSKRY